MRKIDERTYEVVLKPVSGSNRPPELSGGSNSWLHNIFQSYLPVIICVLAPTLLAAIYFGLVASNIYASEAKFVVRSPSDSSASAQITGVIQSMGISKSADDAYAINEFLLSRDALDTLHAKFDLDRVYGAGHADFLSRYPRPFTSPSKEKLYHFFSSMIKIKYDKTTGITTLTVFAFAPQDARAIARLLLESGEALANRLTARIHADLLNTAQAQIERARAQTQDAQAKIGDWRNKEEQIDPTRYSAALVEVLARLSLELAMQRAQAADLEKTTPKSPTLTSLNGRIAALTSQIEQSKLSLAGTTASLAPKIVEFEALQLEKQFAEKIYAASVTSGEAARSDAMRQAIYLDRIVEPNLPDYPAHPHRFLSVILVFAGCLLAYLLGLKIFMNLLRHHGFGSFFGKAR